MKASKTVPATPEGATLRDALQEADMHCQSAQEEIEALCLAISDRIEKNDARTARRLLAMVNDRAFQAMSAINSRAEELGCHFKGEANHV